MSIKPIATGSQSPSCLPDVVLTYLSAANAGRIEEAAECFAADARVHDEQQDHRGRDAIQTWIAHTTQEYQPSNEILAVESHAGSHSIRMKTSGNFPGSPVELEFRLTVENGKITDLAIQ